MITVINIYYQDIKPRGEPVRHTRSSPESPTATASFSLQ